MVRCKCMAKSPKKEVLGVDFGGMILEWAKDEKDVTLSRRNVQDAFESLRQLTDRRFGENVFLISKTEQEKKYKILAWLLTKIFYKRTCISPKNIYFCWERKEKADICKKLGITHFIDDRLENLGYLSNVGVKNLYFFQGRKDEIQKNIRFIPMVQLVNSWSEILSKLLPEVD